MQKDSERALRAVHSRFYLSATPIGIGILGPGLIGSALMEQLREQANTLQREFGVDLRVLAVATSKQMLLRETGIDLEHWREDFAAHAQPVDLHAFGDFLARSYIPNHAVVDCTASDAPASEYITWMKQVGRRWNWIGPGERTPLKVGAGRSRPVLLVRPVYCRVLEHSSKPLLLLPAPGNQHHHA